MTISLPVVEMVEVGRGGMYALERRGKQIPGWRRVWRMVARATMLG